MRFDRLLISLLFVFISSISKAEPAQTESSSLPLPEGYFSLTAGPCHIAVPDRNSGLAEDLLAACKETYGGIYRQLGVDLSGKQNKVDVRVVADPRDMQSLAPPAAEPPPWSGAVAFPEYGLIILSLRDHTGGPVTDLDVSLEHELSHLALREALDGVDVPRWFSEGIAIQQSEESSFQRYWLVWLAARGDNLSPLSAIENYPERLGRINLAYAEAADFLGFLIRKDGWSGVRMVIREMRKGSTFEDAVEFSYGDSLKNLEKEWRAGLMSKWQWVPLITGTGALWGAMVVLFLLAYMTVKRRGRKRLREMEAEEHKLDEMMKPTAARPSVKPKPYRVLSYPTKIRVDDDIHTLH